MAHARKCARVERTQSVCASLSRWTDQIALEIGLLAPELQTWQQELRQLVEGRLLALQATALEESVDCLTHVLAAPLTRQVCVFPVSLRVISKRAIRCRCAPFSTRQVTCVLHHALMSLRRDFITLSHGPPTLHSMCTRLT
jgi:hypothetical protein